jgi:signal transduction histidine kinase
VHRIVTDCNGTIEVSSTVGTGTSVRVRLPVRTADGMESASGTPEHKATA